MVRKRLAKSVVAANALAAALVGGIASDALAVTEFQIGGVNAVWTTSISVGTSIRAQRQDKGLYSPQNGALTGKPDGYQPNVVDEGNLNYDKGILQKNFVVKLNANGEIVLHKKISELKDNYVWDFTELDDGRIALLTNMISLSNYYKKMIVMLNANGELAD